MSNDLSRRKFIGLVGSAGLAAGLVSGSARAEEGKKHKVVFVTGDDEYRSEVTMPMIAQVLRHGNGAKLFDSSVLYALDPKTGKPDPKHKEHIEGLDALKTADLAVFFMRFRALPDDQLNLILDYVNSGKPVMGLRTTTHAFRYPPGHKHEKLNTDFGIELFGQKWITHHGHQSSTEVSVIPARADHPILRGIYATKDPIQCRSWLYHVAPLAGDCEPLLEGRSINSDKAGKENEYPPTQPVAWTKTHKGARVFFTTLGHPKDFEDASVRRLLLNAVYWALGLDVPAGGAIAEVRLGEWGWEAP